MATNNNINPPAALIIASDQNNWETWKEEIEMYFVVAGVDDDKKKLLTLLYLGGPELRRIWKTIEPPTPAPKTPPDDVYPPAIKILDGFFLPKKNLTFERSRFRATVQRDGQSFLAFITELKALRTNCDFNNYNADSALIDQFIEKCSSPKLRKQLLAINDLTVEGLVTLARGEELSNKRAEVIENRLGNTVIKQEPGEVYYSNNSRPQQNHQRKYCYGCGSNQHVHGDEECKAKDAECYKCKNIGHFSSVCMKSNQGQRQQVNNNNGQRQQGNNNSNKSFKGKPHPQQVKLVEEEPVRQQEAYRVQYVTNDDWLFQASTVNANHSKAVILVDNVKTEFIIDSGATCDIIDMSTFNAKFRDQVEVYPTTTNIHTYGATKPLSLHGMFYPCLTYNSNRKIGRVIIVDVEDAGCILSKDTSIALGLLKVHESVNQVSCSSVQGIINQFPEVFEGLGRMKGVKLKLDVDETVKPKIQPHRREPYHKKVMLGAEVDKLLDLGIIEGVKGVTSWCSPLHAVPKPDGSLRLCVDMRKVNEAILRTRYPIPTLDDAIEQIAEAKSEIFSKVDLNKGYHQIELAEESRDITTFSCSKGIFRYCVLPFGISSALDHFQFKLSNLFREEQGIINISDDILIHGPTQADHDDALRRCLEILKENNLTLSKGKCVFNKPELEYFGFTISKLGISPTVSKVSAIQNFPAPTSSQEVRSFLGLINYLIRFIPHLATHTFLLRNLTKKHTKFEWTESEQHAFDYLKSIVTSETVLRHYVTGLRTKIVVDASPVGLGAILFQEQPGDEGFRPVMYSSRSLTNTETRYSQTEREALGVVWGCEKFRLYLVGSHFDIETDHQPLLGIFSANGKPSLRVQGWSMRLQPYDFTLKYIKGKDNPADILSRRPLPYNKLNETQTAKVEEHVNLAIAHAVPKAVVFSDVVIMSENDAEVVAVKRALRTGRWNEEPFLRPFYQIKGELSVRGGILLRGQRLFIPKGLRNKVLQVAHETHMGVSKTKAMLREKVWWPSLAVDVETLIKSCVPCLSTLPAAKPEPLKMTEIAGVWENLHVDICGPFPDGVSILGIIDQCSRYPKIYSMVSTTATEVIKRLEACFFDMGVPKQIITDNGSQFAKSHEFRDFCVEWGIEHRKVIPIHPESNSGIERYFRTLLKAIRIAHAEKKDWMHELLRYIFNYRNTPHQSTGVTPTSLIFNGRVLNDKLPLFPRKEPKRVSEARANDNRSKKIVKKYADRGAKTSDVKVGDQVLLKQKKKNKFSTSFNRIPYDVTERTGSKLMLKQTETGRSYCRHVAAVRKIVPKKEEETEEEQLPLTKDCAPEDQITEPVAVSRDPEKKSQTESLPQTALTSDSETNSTVPAKPVLKVVKQKVPQGIPEPKRRSTRNMIKQKERDKEERRDEEEATLTDLEEESSEDDHSSDGDYIPGD